MPGCRLRRPAPVQLQRALSGPERRRSLRVPRAVLRRQRQRSLRRHLLLRRRRPPGLGRARPDRCPRDSALARRRDGGRGVGGGPGPVPELHPADARAGNGRAPGHHGHDRQRQPQRELAGHDRHLRRAGRPHGSLRSPFRDRRLLHELARAPRGGRRGKGLRRAPPGHPLGTPVPLPAGVRVELSNNFPTTNDSGAPAAIDPKIGVLQARDASGRPLFTLMSLAAHNQEIGHSDDPATALELSSDWPGYFAARAQALGGGMGVFLVGDNGSEEDPETVPPVGCTTGCQAQAKATGETLADAVMAQVPHATAVQAGSVSLQRRELYVPLENNLFRAAAAAGLFGERQTYVGEVPAGRAGTQLLTEVNVADLGPDLQLIGNPGEAFPALMLGGPWGIDQAGCPERPNPPVPTWHAHAKFRLQVGLANDMIGYEIPPWAYSSQPGVFTTSYGDDLTCVNDSSDKDPKGHQHKLETEGIGPTGSAMVAGALTDLLSKEPDGGARIVVGRYIQPDGSLTRTAAGAVGIWIAGSGAIFAGHGSATFMDYDGAAQPGGPDITTRGISQRGRRFYLDVYPNV